MRTSPPNECAMRSPFLIQRWTVRSDEPTLSAISRIVKNFVGDFGRSVFIRTTSHRRRDFGYGDKVVENSAYQHLSDLKSERCYSRGGRRIALGGRTVLRLSRKPSDLSF
jgi:hypothetical protein